jgi:putative glutamine amidotransferase
VVELARTIAGGAAVMTQARPVIGIVCCSRVVGDEIAQAVINRYLEAALLYADCAALLVPARPDLMRAGEVAERLDGLFLTGSPSNVDPVRYGDAEGAGEGPFDAGRDAMGFQLIDAMIERGRPVFGVCRGFQELNVAFGGSLARDLGEGDRPLPHHAPGGVSLEAMFGHAHDVTLTRGGVLAEALGRDRLHVSSVHFQGVDRLGEGLAIEAVAPDGVIEAISAKVNGAAILGVQWHPEWQTDRDAASIGFFGLFGRVLRGEPAAWAERPLAETHRDMGR